MASEKARQLSAAQSELLRHWQDLSVRVGDIARRDDLDAGQLRAHLANITILDVSLQRQPVVRLAGEAVRRLIGADPRGKALDLWRGRLEGWIDTGLADCLASASPQAGQGLALPCGRRHAWLRLPLADEAGAFNLVLCHDAWLAAETEAPGDEPHSLIHAPEILIAA